MSHATVPARSPSRSRRWVRWGLPGLALLASVTSVVPGAAQTLPDPTSPIPNDPAVTMGTLPNGLRYYIRPNDLPESRAQLRLVVNAGSVQEADDERGIAHFLEHMAFNGTENFGPNELVEYLESIGMRFGSDLNATTSFEETIYQLEVPTDEPEILRQAFQILEDWAHGITFDPDQIEEERGVIVEEWRLRQGAGSRIADRQLPIMFRGSIYAERIPIGELDQIRGFAREDFLAFYERWYRPDLMAVVAVGDFAVEEIEGLVAEHFSEIEPRSDPVPHARIEVPGHPETLFAITPDPEATSTSIEVDLKRPARDYGTVGDRREGLLIAYHNELLNDRLSEIALEPGAPFLGASVGTASLGRYSAIDAFGAGVETGKAIEGLRAVLREARRVQLHGFTEAELERVKTNQLRGLERSYAERENRYSSSFVGELVTHFLEGGAFSSLEWEYDMLRAVIPTITLAEVDAKTPDWFDTSNRVIGMVSPERSEVPVPTQAELLAVFDEVLAEELEPWEEDALGEELVAVPPTPGRVVSEDVVDDLDLTIWELSNGVRVLVKPTDFRDDQILMNSYSPGGTSLLDDDVYQTVGNAVGIVGAGGLGDFTGVELGKRLAGTVATANPSVGGASESVSGSASPQDLETLLQLTYLRFTAPRKDPEIFEVAKAQLKSSLETRGASPASDFSDTLRFVMTQDHPRARPPTLEDVDRLDLDGAFEFYRDRFADASDFTFVFVGAIDLEVLRPLVETYLGSLPSIGRVEEARDTGIDPPDGVIEKVVRRGLEPRAQTQLIFAGPTEYTREGAAAMGFLADALEVRLRERLREDLGGTYSVGASGGLSDEPDDEYVFSVAFGSDPGRVDELVAAVFAEIDSIKGGVDISQAMANRKEAGRRSHETAVKTNTFWVSGLLASDRLGRDPHELLELTIAESVTPEMVVEAANRYLRTDRFVRVTLLPESGGALSSEARLGSGGVPWVARRQGGPLPGAPAGPGATAGVVR